MAIYFKNLNELDETRVDATDAASVHEQLWQRANDIDPSQSDRMIWDTIKIFDSK
jgi:hypothetical protein